MNEFIAFCGLNCETCEARIATLTNDAALHEKVAKQWSEMNGVEITPEMTFCHGCRTGELKTPYCASLCPVRQCALSKQYETCGDCAALDSCEKVAPFLAYNPEIRKNLKG